VAVWEDERISADKDIFFTRITTEGDILDPTGVAICTAPGHQTSPKVAVGDQNYLVVWQDDRDGTYDIYGARIDTDGNLLDPDGFPISAASGWENSPDVAWDGTNFLVVWSDDRSLISQDIYGARIASDGYILDGGGFQISSDEMMELSPSLAYNGSNYLVTWEIGAG
jgi:hypothetical protein